MLTVLNKRWIAQGWRAMTPEDAEPMALVWIEVMDINEIPWQHYNHLYQKAMLGEMIARREGKKVFEFSVVGMATYWPELREELRQREIEKGRTLTGHATSTCPLCFGTGREYRFDDAGHPVGVTGKACEHNGPADSVYLLDGKPATYADFEALHKRNLRVVEAQERADEPTASDILLDAADHVWRLADESTDADERVFLSNLWLRLVRSARYCRENPE